jgi:hypothetical protein
VSPTKRVLLAIPSLLLLAAPVQAWPSETMKAIGRDARRLLPGSLSRLLGARERELVQETSRLPPELTQALARDLPAGALQPDTLALVDGEIDRVVQLLREGRVSEGLVRLGALLRVVSDLSDPVLAAGPEGWPPGLTGEYYALFAANLDKMPVVVDDPHALELARPQLGALLQSIAQRSRAQAPTIRAELVRGGRVVSHKALDYRSPAWAVASLSYSRAVTGTAAIWLAVWRAARGDTTRMGRAHEVVPMPAPPRPGAGIPTSAETMAVGEPSAPPPANDRRPLQPEAP